MLSALSLRLGCRLAMANVREGRNRLKLPRAEKRAHDRRQRRAAEAAAKAADA